MVSNQKKETRIKRSLELAYDEVAPVYLPRLGHGRTQGEAFGRRRLSDRMWISASVTRSGLTDPDLHPLFRLCIFFFFYFPKPQGLAYAHKSSANSGLEWNSGLMASFSF